MPWLTPAVTLACSLLTAVLAGPVLRLLPEPAEDAAGKPPYASLATPAFAAAAGALAFAASSVAFALTDARHWPAWSSLTTVGVLAVLVDARTTWLPLPLARAGWAVAGAGAAFAAVASANWTPLAAAAAGALALGGLFHLLWRFTGAFGYGDVRLAGTIGAVTALDSPALVAWSLLLGTAAGAVLGLVHRGRGGAGPFAYGPGLLAGPFLALLARALLP